MNSLIIHGHFYQPPRENPWTGKLETEPGAQPFHDWNERITAECYAPNAHARVANTTVNNFAKISFNFGPTLLSWMEEHHPETYKLILEADRQSVAERGGHGNAIAQAYGHAILPLCNDRDRQTQIIWGIADFRHRFRREPEALWLPETACNDETLSVLIEQRLRYLILAPSQAERIRSPGGNEWLSVADGSIDVSKVYRYFHRDGSGRSIAIFFYDGPLARAIAFERALSSSETLVGMFKDASLGKGRTGGLVNIATDGETYGHHFKFGDLCLAHTVEVEAPCAGFQITNYGEYLERHPAEFEVEIKKGANGEGTAWSCAHGVSRWIRDCGCHTGADAGWNQKWRGPLRDALEFLRDEAAREFERVGGALFHDVWAARDAYVQVVLDPGGYDQFLVRHNKAPLSLAEQQVALSLLEIQRYSLLMFTSCGWFFNDISGIEPLQILKYACRVIELMDELDLSSPRERFLEILAEARSNRSELGNGADVYRNLVEPTNPNFQISAPVMAGELA
jgi:alpha-amylase/alpha-mannosidase (GH57 family)